MDLKELIYLDTKFLHSFIAQLNSGLPTTKSVEYQEQETKTSTESILDQKLLEVGTRGSTGGMNLGGFFEIPSAAIQAKVGTQRGTTDTIALSASDAAKEIINTQLHDNALHELEHYLDEHHLLKYVTPSSSAELGSYIKVNGKLRIFDLTLLKSIISIDFMENLFKIEIKRKIDEMNIQQISSKQKQEAKRALENELNEFKSPVQAIENLIHSLENFLPTSTYLKVGRFVAPLRTDHLREIPSELSFKYGAESNLDITMLGKVTRKYDTLLEQGMDSSFFAMFDQLSNMMGAFLSEIKFLEQGDFIVSPIAIYFEVSASS
jgi:hypothetical protein